MATSDVRKSLLELNDQPQQQQVQIESQAKTWVKLSECDEFIGPKRSKHTMVTYGNSLYVFGGDNGKHMINDLVTYDSSNKSWGRALNSAPPTPRYHHTAVIYNSSMFVFGGYTGDLNSNANLCNKNDLYEYRFGNGTWYQWNVQDNPAPAPRAAHGAVVYDDKLWVFAGYGNQRLNDMWCIQLNNQQSRCWKEVEQTGDQPPTVCNFTVAAVQDAMYLFSGQSGTKTSNTLFKFDFKTSNWSKAISNHILRSSSPPPERRSGHVMVSHENCLYIYGGVLGNSFFHDLYSFDLETKTWTLIPISMTTPIPSARSFMAASVFGDALHIFGGNVDQNTRSNELFRFKLPIQPRCTLKEDFYKLLKKELLCDLIFIINDVRIKAHCAIVACRSVYLRQRIKTVVTSSSPTAIDEASTAAKPLFCLNSVNSIDIKITDTNNPNAFKIVLEFIYTDSITSIEGKEHEIESLKLMADVYKLADQFMIGKLVNVCESFFESIISCVNVLKVLEYVDKLNLNYLKECCMKYLTKESNFRQIVMSSEFEHLDQALMVEIIRRHQSPLKSVLKVNDLSSIENQPAFSHDKYQSIEQDFENFFRNGVGNEFSDVIIQLSESNAEKYFYGHKCILAARCSYFEAFFRSFTPKNHTVHLTIGDTEPPYDSALSLLKYIYYGLTNMSPKDALYLFCASHYFQFSNSRLHIFCKKNLEANVSKNNVFDILQAADRIQAGDMKAFALKMIRNSFAELAHSENIRKLSKELLLDILVDISHLFTKFNFSTTSIHQLSAAASSANSHSSSPHSNTSSPQLLSTPTSSSSTASTNTLTLTTPAQFISSNNNSTTTSPIPSNPANI